MKMNRIVSVVLVAAIIGLGSAFVSPASGTGGECDGQSQLVVTVETPINRVRLALSRREMILP